MLNRLRAEELEERQRMAREEAENRKKQLEAEKLKKQHQSRLVSKDTVKIGSQKPITKISEKKISIDPKRPAFMTITEPFQSYRNFILMRQNIPQRYYSIFSSIICLSRK